MENWYNNSGKPFSAEDWLIVHHNAKLKERLKFATSVVSNSPKRIIDLGCGTGLWLDLFSKIMPKECELVGVDLDENNLESARKRSLAWDHPSSFLKASIEDIDKVPEADLYLIYNMFSYLKEPSEFLRNLKTKLNRKGKISIRQYDGNLIRFGPISDELRFKVDAALRASVSTSLQFRYYDLDRTFRIISDSEFNQKSFAFENLQHVSPFDSNFSLYFEKTLQWIIEHLNHSLGQELINWYEKSKTSHIYFIATDLTASLS